MEVSLPRKPFGLGHTEQLVTLIKIQDLKAFRLLKACLVASGHLVSIGNQCYMLYSGGMGDRMGMSDWIQAHFPPRNITEHQICRLAGLRDLPWAPVEPHGSEASQLGGEIMPRKASENVNC